ncbi:MAG TPA: peptidylprolyl isomerase [Casimicrobiaceae bacterium]|nr:peptidylprolyl isomerase [Casimicrobiaceae bacterium]
MIRKFLREPLVHFIALGALVFLLFHFNADRDAPQDGKIVVTPGKVEQLVTGFSRTWHRPPTQQELDGLVEDHIREEVLYREALAMGLDKDDTIVRRRMRQKLEFLTEDAGAAVLPTDQDLQSWLDQHPEKFRVEPEIAFSQVYFNTGRRGESASAAAAKAYARLNRAGRNIAPLELGDPTMLPHDLPLSRVDEVASVFGKEFAQQVSQLEPGSWGGPVQSSYGWHLVYVSERTEGRSRPLSEVREGVQREWLTARRNEIVDATYRKLREKYAIVVEGPQPPADAGSQPGNVANAAQRQ